MLPRKWRTVIFSRSGNKASTAVFIKRSSNWTSERRNMNVSFTWQTLFTISDSVKKKSAKIIHISPTCFSTVNRHSRRNKTPSYKIFHASGSTEYVEILDTLRNSENMWNSLPTYNYSSVGFIPTWRYYICGSMIFLLSVR